MYVQESPKLLGLEVSSFWSTKATHGLLTIVPLQCYSVRGQSKKYPDTARPLVKGTVWR